MCKRSCALPKQAGLQRLYPWGSFALLSLVKFSHWEALAEVWREGGEWGWASYSIGSFSAASGWLCPLMESHRFFQGVLCTWFGIPDRVRLRDSLSLTVPCTVHIPLWTSLLLTSSQGIILLSVPCQELDGYNVSINVFLIFDRIFFWFLSFVPIVLNSQSSPPAQRRQHHGLHTVPEFYWDQFIIGIYHQGTEKPRVDAEMSF